MRTTAAYASRWDTAIAAAMSVSEVVLGSSECLSTRGHHLRDSHSRTPSGRWPRGERRAATKGAEKARGNYAHVACPALRAPDPLLQHQAEKPHTYKYTQAHKRPRKAIMNARAISARRARIRSQRTRTRATLRTITAPGTLLQLPHRWEPADPRPPQVRALLNRGRGRRPLPRQPRCVTPSKRSHVRSHAHRSSCRNRPPAEWIAAQDHAMVHGPPCAGSPPLQARLAYWRVKMHDKQQLNRQHSQRQNGFVQPQFTSVSTFEDKLVRSVGPSIVPVRACAVRRSPCTLR